VRLIERVCVFESVRVCVCMSYVALEYDNESVVSRDVMVRTRGPNSFGCFFSCS